MSQEASPNIEIPSPWRYKVAKKVMGKKIRENIDFTISGLQHIPFKGPVNTVGVHRNRKWDVPLYGYGVSDVRTPFYPAKKKYKKGIEGFIMSGSGALFFDDENEVARAGVVRSMWAHIQQGHMLITLPEGTSRVRGPELGPLEPGALEIGLRAGLDEMIVMALGGTETSSGEDEDEEIMPTRVHLEIGKLSLLEARKKYESTSKKDKKSLVTDLTETLVRPSLQDVFDTANEKIVS